MKIGEKGIELIKEFEAFRSKPYLCPAGKWTIGYGSTGGITKDTPPITEQQAVELLCKDISIVEKAINKYFTKHELAQNQFDALCSLFFNIGVGNIPSSSVFRLWQDGKDEDAAEAFLLWNKITQNGKKIVSAGLVRRRQAEMQLFLSED